MMNVPVKVLIAGVDPENTAVLQALVATLSMDVIVACDLTSARIAVAACAPRVILLDRMLPDGDSADLVAEIRESGLAMAIAGLVECEEQRKTAAFPACGIDAIFSKPLDTAALGAWIQEKAESTDVASCCSDPNYADRQIGGRSCRRRTSARNGNERAARNVLA